MFCPVLPVDSVLQPLHAALAAHPVVILQAAPGAGKTTRVPLALLEADWLAERSILLLEPRRLAATNAARYMAASLGEKAGGRVGYTIRHQQAVSASTRIEVVTEGILTRRLQSDPELTGVGLVILDEFHERSLNTDLALALVRDVQLGLRPDLRLLVMSATLDSDALSRLLGDAPVIASPGRSFPVEIRHLGAAVKSRDLVAACNASVRRLLREEEGDILIFLPGAAEIRQLAALLADVADICVAPLYADLAFAEQEAAILPQPGVRRVVLATNIAETSLTIEGIRIVVDGGYERRPVFDAGRGLSRLDTVRISRASAQQRAGRAGRLGPGIVCRLYSVAEEAAFLPFAPPEIRTVDLAPLALELAGWGVSDPAGLIWLDPPPAGHFAAARQLLQRLGILDNDRLTPLGRALARLPLHPRFGRLLLAAAMSGDPRRGATVAALLSERLPRRLEASADLAERLARWDEDNLFGEPAAAATIRRAVDQYLRLVRDVPAGPSAGVECDWVAAGWPERIGRRRDTEENRYLLADGSGVYLPGVGTGPEWIVALESRFGRNRHDGEVRLYIRCSDALIRQLEAAAPQIRETLWDDASGRVTARRVRRYGALVLSEEPQSVRDEEAVPLLCAWLRREGLDRLRWSQRAMQLRARIAFAGQTFPEENWPSVDDAGLLESLEDWLGDALAGCCSRDDLARLDPADALLHRLDYRQRFRLETIAPERLAVPGGSQPVLDYLAEGGPLLEIKLQELFGLAETPRIADGRVPLLVSLLSPAGRPLAMTRDLRSFWDKVYPEVKKEMKGRYPKHPWPDDPWQAVPTRLTNRRLAKEQKL